MRRKGERKDEKGEGGKVGGRGRTGSKGRERAGGKRVSEREEEGIEEEAEELIREGRKTPITLPMGRTLTSAAPT